MFEIAPRPIVELITKIKPKDIVFFVPILFLILEFKGENKT